VTGIISYSRFTLVIIKDLQIFKKDQLIDDEEFGFFIVGERDKNGNETIIPLFKSPYAMAVIKKYGSDKSNLLIFKKETFIEEQAYYF